MADALSELESIGKPVTGMGQLKGMNHKFMDSFNQMASEYYAITGEQIRVDDAFRTEAQQAEGYRRKPTLVAPPGYSNHPKGLAADIDPNQANRMAELGLFDKYGFMRPMMGQTPGSKYEPWHIELAPNFGKQASAKAYTKGDPLAELDAIGSNPPLMPKTAAVPQIELPTSPAPQAPAAPPQAAPVDQGIWQTVKDVGAQLYEGSPIPGLVDTAKMVSIPFRPSTYQDMAKTLEKPIMSAEGAAGQIGQGMIKALPAAGGMVGGTVGALAGAGVMSPVLGAAGMGLGYGIGERAQKLLETYLGTYEPKSLKEELKQTATAIGTGTKSFIQGESGFKALTLAGGPLAGQFQKLNAKGDTARLGQEMVDAKMPISPDIYAPSPPTKFLQWATDNIIPGGNILANQRRKVVNDTISQMRQDFVEAAGLPNPFTPASQAKAVKNRAYEQFIKEGEGVGIEFPTTAKFIEENIDSPALQTSGTLKQKVIEFNKKINQSGEHEMLFKRSEVPKNQLEVYDALAAPIEIKSKVTINELNDLLPYIWSRTKSTTQMGKGKNQYEKLTEESVNFRNGLKDAIDSDLAVHEVNTGSKVLEALNIARQSQKDLSALAKAKYLEKMLEGSTTWNPQTQHWDFQPGKFYSDVTKKKELLQSKFPEEFTAIMQFAEKAKLASTDVARMTPKPGWKQAAELAITGGLGTAIYANPFLAVPLAFPAIAAYSLMNPSGTLRKLLTTGMKPPTLTKETIQLGVMNKEKD